MRNLKYVGLSMFFFINAYYFKFEDHHFMAGVIIGGIASFLITVGTYEN